MRLIIEARLADGDSDTVNDGDGVLAVVERRDCSLAQLGLTLAEGRSLLAKVQAELVSKQVEWWLSGQTHCRRCGAALNHKDSRSTVLRTVYVSSSIAESAVNQAVSHRMAEKGQMRWTGEGAHCMVQVRVAVLNGEFSPRRISALEIAASRHGKCIGAVSPGRHRPTNRTDHATLPQARAA
jgi:hypothetical protein